MTDAMTSQVAEVARKEEREAIAAWLREYVAPEAFRMILTAGLPGGTRTARTKAAAYADGIAHAVSMIRKGIDEQAHLETDRG